MARPVRYSSEVPMRCAQLIKMLGPHVDEHSDPNGPWGGPLRTTFLMAMAGPMIILPVERIYKPMFARAGVASDVLIDPNAGRRVTEALGPDKRFGDAPFFVEAEWSYVHRIRSFPVGNSWSEKALTQMASAHAFRDAADASAADIILLLRNALAHGGVAYLDIDGRQTESATNMLGFAGFSRRGEGDLSLLRVAVPAFEIFLQRWAAWLSDAGVKQLLERAGPGHFDVLGDSRAA